MRTIKFRAFENGVMYNKLVYITMRGGAMSCEPDVPLLKPILMQFTGLKDKHGVEIYEGDAVQYFRANQDNNSKRDLDESDLSVGVVGFSEGAFVMFETDLSDTQRQMKDGMNEWYSIENCWEMEVIGNIHEKEDLIGEK